MCMGIGPSPRASTNYNILEENCPPPQRKHVVETEPREGWHLLSSVNPQFNHTWSRVKSASQAECELPSVIWGFQYLSPRPASLFGEVVEVGFLRGVTMKVVPAPSPCLSNASHPLWGEEATPCSHCHDVFPKIMGSRSCRLQIRMNCINLFLPSIWS